MWNTQDIEQLNTKGITTGQLDNQLAFFRKGTPKLDIVKPCDAAHGILQLSSEERERYRAIYSKDIGKTSLGKFVPASGAASRMFEILQGDQMGSEDSIRFFNRLQDFAFWDDLKLTALRLNEDLSELVKQQNWKRISHILLDPEGLNFIQIPKGLVPFHRYKYLALTPFEEHLSEAFECFGDTDHYSVHFTVSADRKEEIYKFLQRHIKTIPIKPDLQLSVQKASTDLLAVDVFNEPFRKENGDLLFRPGGHGALIHNLNDLEQDVVFIRNIDNVVPKFRRNLMVEWHAIFGGMLLDIRHKMKRSIVHEDKVGLEYLWRIFFGQQEFPGEKKAIDLLDKPTRICGMVPNEGEPGGGPFWVRDQSGWLKRQIIEKSQLHEDQVQLLERATHFNPVNMVCSLTSPMGGKYDLMDFVDHDSAFISRKSFEGRELKAMELPGLWNGAMSEWNTLFVEMPKETFNPVKKVNDLLRPEHQVE